MEYPKTIIALYLLLASGFLNPISSLACVGEPAPPEKLCFQADWIVRAVAVKYVKEPEQIKAKNYSYLSDGDIQFRVVEVLKGEEVPPTLLFKGLLTDKDDFNDNAVPYKYGRRLGRDGCRADMYKEGGEFLLFLRSRNGQHKLYHPPLSPANEQLRSPADPWLVWVRDYLVKSERKAKVVRLLDILTFQRWLFSSISAI